MMPVGRAALAYKRNRPSVAVLSAVVFVTDKNDIRNWLPMPWFTS